MCRSVFVQRVAHWMSALLLRGITTENLSQMHGSAFSAEPDDYLLPGRTRS